MADRVLRWYLDGRLSEYGGGVTEVGGVHRLDQDYRPVGVFLGTNSNNISTGRTIEIDINDDGVSIFDSDAVPSLPTGLGKHFFTTINQVAMREGSIVTLDIDQVSNTVAGEDLTVELHLGKA